VTFGDSTINAFLDELGSPTPVPSGGAVSAVTAALAAGLVAMVAELSGGRPKYGPFAATTQSGRGDWHRLAAALVKLADRDAAAFGAYMAASTMPRYTADEQAARSASLAGAARKAIEPPRLILAACVEIATLTEQLAGRSNLSLASDLVVASRLAESAAYSAAENVLVNLPSVADTAEAAVLEAEARRLQRSVSRLARGARAQIANRSVRDPEFGPHLLAVGDSNGATI
jgi:formiminotetrahydrofolate cyclodeaminase